MIFDYNQFLNDLSQHWLCVIPKPRTKNKRTSWLLSLPTGGDVPFSWQEIFIFISKTGPRMAPRGFWLQQTLQRGSRLKACVTAVSPV